jgi:hypothetical protein
MTKLAYLSSTALCALALVAGASPAAADGVMGGTDIYGQVNFGYDWLNYDPDGASDFHNNTFVAQGAFGVPVGGNWSVEGNFSFETQQIDNDITLGFDTSWDTWQVGGVLNYNFDGQGRIGFDAAYETVDIGLSVDGYRVGARGEYYLQPNATLRATAGYQDYDDNGIEFDGFYGGVGGSYYFTRNIGLRGDINYYTYDFSLPLPLPGSHDYDVWDFGAKLQYKCDDYPLVFGGHVNYATVDAFGNDTNVWNFGIDITAMFGSGASKASLRDAEVNSTWEPERIGVKYVTF